MPTATCTIGISFKENVHMYGQELEVFKPLYLARVIFPGHFTNEYNRIKQMIDDCNDFEKQDARVEILDKASGKCGLVFNMSQSLAQKIVDTSKLYFAVKYTSSAERPILLIAD